MTQYGDQFNKEKLIFLGAALLLAGAAYQFFAHTPAPVVTGQAVTALPMPTALAPEKAESRPQVEYYVIDGKKTGLADVRSGDLVNRERATPFAPFTKEYEICTDWKSKAIPPIDRLPPDIAEAITSVPAPEPKEFPHCDKTPKVAFMGVVMTERGDTCALLKPLDGSSPRRVKVGDSIAEYNYRVTRIEKQAIWVSDGDSTPFVLRDTDKRVARADAKGNDDAGATQQKAAAKQDRNGGTPKKKGTVPQTKDGRLGVGVKA